MLSVKLADYYSPSTKEFDVQLTKGPHHVKAIFEGRGASAVNTDLARMATMNFWQGRVESLPFAILLTVFPGNHRCRLKDVAQRLHRAFWVVSSTSRDSSRPLSSACSACRRWPIGVFAPRER